MEKIIWLILLIVFIFVEAATVGMVSLWFAAGALAALVAAMLGAKIGLQILLFFLVSGGLLVALRPWIKKYFNPKRTRTNVDAVIGTQCLVVADIDNIRAQGQVRLNGVEWSARSTDGSPIAAGTLVRVDKVEGVKVFVTVLEVPANI